MLTRSHVLLLALVAGCQIRNATFTGVDGGDSPGDATVDAPSSGPHCAQLPATCGAHGDDSCCNTLLVSAGTFDRGYDKAGDSDGIDADMSFPATVSAFWLDKYEVTVGRFRAFVKAGMGTKEHPPMLGAGAHPNITADSGWEQSSTDGLLPTTKQLTDGLQSGRCTSLHTWTDEPAGNENRPIDCVTWYEAMAFCAWDGGYLPTEAEWNYAAAGGSLQRARPWSIPPENKDIDSGFTSFRDGRDRCEPDGTFVCTVTDLVEVGTRSQGDGLWDQSDLGGGVNEWTLDWYATAYPMPCMDCAQLTAASERAVRGGDFDADQSHLRTGWRDHNFPGNRDFTAGFRCARAAPPNAATSAVSTETSR